MTRRVKHQKLKTNRGSEGFALILIAALFTAFAVVATVFLDNETVTTQLNNQHIHQLQLAKIQSALIKFLLKEGRLPCPARYSISPNDATMAGEYGFEMHPIKSDGSAVSSISDCSKAVDTTPGWIGTTASGGPGVDVLTSPNSEFVRGMVPFKALEPYGVTEDDAYDAQGDRVMYIVNRQVTGGLGINAGANDFAGGNATGYTTDSATLTDKVAGKVTKVDFLLVAYGEDKLGGIGHDLVPVPSGQGIDCSSANSNIPQKLLNCTLTPTVPCPATNALAAKNCNNDLNFIIMPRNLSTQAVAVAGADTASLAYTEATSFTNKTYFDDSVVGTSVTCPNGTLTRNADGQCTNTYCWGSNSSGQLGNGTQTTGAATSSVNADSSVPVPVKLPRGVASLQSISVGELAGSIPQATVCGITGDVTVAAFGDVWCWGSNTNVSSGAGSVSTAPVQIIPPTITPPTGGTAQFKFATIQVGYYSTCGMGVDIVTTSDGTTTTKPDGNIYCWGNNQYGQLGNGTTSSATIWTVTPAAVTLPTGVTGFSSFSGDGTHWCALGSDGQVYCWGNNANGQLGFSTGTAPATALIPTLADVVNSEATTLGGIISSIGSKGTTALLSTGKVIGWSSQWVATENAAIDVSTLGLTSVLTGGGVTINDTESTRDVTGFGSGAAQHQCVSVANAANTSVAVATYCRGSDSNGQLGDNTITNNSQFVLAQAPTGVTFTSISVGDSVSCGIGSDGHAYCWGKNNYGQLGNHTTTDAHVPTKVKLPGNVINFIGIATGGATNCALSPP